MDVAEDATPLIPIPQIQSGKPVKPRVLCAKAAAISRE